MLTNPQVINLRVCTSVFYCMCGLPYVFQCLCGTHGAHPSGSRLSFVSTPVPLCYLSSRRGLLSGFPSPAFIVLSFATLRLLPGPPPLSRALFLLVSNHTRLEPAQHHSSTHGNHLRVQRGSPPSFLQLGFSFHSCLCIGFSPSSRSHFFILLHVRFLLHSRRNASC